MSILQSNKRKNISISTVVEIDDISDLSGSDNEPIKKKKKPSKKDLKQIINNLRQIQIESEFVLQFETVQEKNNFELNYKTSVYSQFFTYTINEKNIKIIMNVEKIRSFDYLKLKLNIINMKYIIETRTLCIV